MQYQPVMPNREQLSQEEELIKLATRLRINVIKMLTEAGSGHPGSSLGLADFFAVFYKYILRHNPVDPANPDRDRFFLSAGHVCPILYATLAEMGYFPVEELTTLRRLNTRLQGHPERQIEIGLENTAGPLGQGLSMAVGCAYDLKIKNSPAHIYALSSDGEQQEGQSWEAYQFAAQHDLHNFTLLIDVNDIQISGRVSQVMNQRDLGRKLTDFGFQVFRVNGHSYLDLARVFRDLRNFFTSHRQPQALLLDTIPGKGVSFMEDNYLWHGKAPNQAQAQAAIAELKNNLLAKNYDQ